MLLPFMWLTIQTLQDVFVLKEPDLPQSQVHCCRSGLSFNFYFVHTLLYQDLEKHLVGPTKQNLSVNLFTLMNVVQVFRKYHKFISQARQQTANFEATLKFLSEIQLGSCHDILTFFASGFHRCKKSMKSVSQLRICDELSRRGSCSSRLQAALSFSHLTLPPLVTAVTVE